MEIYLFIYLKLFALKRLFIYLFIYLLIYLKLFALKRSYRLVCLFEVRIGPKLLFDCV